jgi:hypothetical protein
MMGDEPVPDQQND